MRHHFIAQFSIDFAYVSILCCSLQDMMMVVSSCPPSLHWERHQRLRLRMAIGVVLCEIGDAPASSISSHLSLRSQVLAAFDGHEAALLFFSAVAVSGTVVCMTGNNFVGSSCVEVPAASLSRPRVLLHTSSIGFRPHCGLSATSALSCWAATFVTTCCTSVTCVVRFGHLPILLFFPLRRTRTFFTLCAFLLSGPT